MTDHTITSDERQRIESAVARLRAGILAIVFGMVGGTGLFVATAWLLIKGGPNVGATLGLLGNYLPGYAVMNNGITKILIVGWAKGYGITMDKAGKETFVDDFVVAVGPGIELASSRGVFVFNDPAALEAFRAGQWDFGADADAAFKFGDFGGAAIAADQGGAVDVYRVFQNGVGLHASLFWFHSGIDEDLEPGMQPPAQ